MADYELVHGSTEALPTEATINGSPAPHQVQLVAYVDGTETVTDTPQAWKATPYQPAEPRGYYHVFTLAEQDGQRVITHTDQHVRIV